MATIGAQISDTGIVAPNYSDILQEIKIIYLSIYGSDVNLDPDTQDGQFLAVLAQAVFDSNQTMIDLYNSFSPSTARGVQLSSLVKINGLRRVVSTNSEVILTIGGAVGTQIENGVVGDNVNLGTRWDLPTLVIIPITGTIDVTATCEEIGGVAAGIGVLTKILTPTLGWQTVTNTAIAVPGKPVETDAQLRVRQSRSIALPSLTILDGINAAVEAVIGVTRLKIYENDSDVTDADGIPSHSIAAVVNGGDVQQIANAIALKKAPGTGTSGTTVVIVVDSRGVPSTIKFFALSIVPMKVQINIHPLTGYVSTTGDNLKQNIVDFINSLDIGEDSYLARLYSPANLSGVGLGATYVVTAITQARLAGALAAADVVILFNEGAALDIANVTLVLV